MLTDRRKWFLKGLKDGIPIMLGYFAVSIALGISARNAGMTAPQATIASALIMASAGQYIGFTLIAAGASYLEVVVMEAIANARYLLMSCALSQKVDSGLPLRHRLLMGLWITDEIFGVSVSVEGRLNPYYNYGMAAVATPGWALGTLMGVVLGNALPARVVSALSVGLFGMFMSIFVPPMRKNRIIAALVALSFMASYAMNALFWFDGISSGMKIILLTVAISLGAALLFPVKGEGDADEA
ncbi:MAG: AzlC family ABC transporter permease [Clostridia bacterium]|nr:AzlC family ABC transporter permease [Clostridia bacterium]MBR6891533.1 AzlC family ABC transporter permease [Clostridia bacterium]